MLLKVAKNTPVGQALACKHPWESFQTELSGREPARLVKSAQAG